MTWNAGESRKGSLMPLSKKKRTRRTEVFIFHALIVKTINIFKQSVIFLWYLMRSVCNYGYLLRGERIICHRRVTMKMNIKL